MTREEYQAAAAKLCRSCKRNVPVRRLLTGKFAHWAGYANGPSGTELFSDCPASDYHQVARRLGLMTGGEVRYSVDELRRGITIPAEIEVREEA